MSFDLATARKDGYSDDEIATFLSGQHKFDLVTAKKDGYSSAEIAEFLANQGGRPAVKRGVIGDIAAAIPAGAIDTVEQFSRALRTLDPQGGIDIAENLGTKGVEFAKSYQESHPGMFTAPEGTVRSSIYGGVRSFIPSVTAGIPGAVVGSMGGPVGTIGGFAGFGGTVFGLA